MKSKRTKQGGGDTVPSLDINAVAIKEPVPMNRAERRSLVVALADLIEAVMLDTSAAAADDRQQQQQAA